MSTSRDPPGDRPAYPAVYFAEKAEVAMTPDGEVEITFSLHGTPAAKVRMLPSTARDLFANIGTLPDRRRRFEIEGPG